MKKVFKDLFTTKKGILVVLAMMSVAISAYLNIITVKSVNLFGVSWLNISLGTLAVSFIPMITSEIMSEVYGWKKGFVISSVAYTICLIFTLILDLTTRIGVPTQVYDWVKFNEMGDPIGLIDGFNEFTILNDGFVASYNTLFRGSYVIIIASAIAYYLGIFFNCYIMGKMQKKAIESGKDTNAKRFGRFVLSTVVGQTLDNGIFFLIPMIVVLIAPSLHQGALSPWSWNYVLVQTVAAFVIEILYEIIFFPLTNFLTKKVNSLPEDNNSVTAEVEKSK